MPGEIIGAQLVLEVEPLIAQIGSPAAQLIPVMLGEAGMALYLGQRGDHQKHVTSFLGRHLILFAMLPSAIHLAVRLRIGAEVVRRERELPARHRRIVQDRPQLRLQQGSG